MTKFSAPSSSSLSVWTEIEQAIQRRRIGTAKRLIAAQLRRSRGDSEVLFRGCDGYRRLGLFLDGFRALDLDEKGFRRKQSTRDHEGRKLLWAARFLNLLGAPAFARRLTEQIEPHSCEDHRILGSLALSYYEPERALGFLEKMRVLDPDPASYSSRVAELTVSDALADCGRYEEAVRTVDRVVARSPEQVLLAIGGQARGEYLARAGRMDEALPALEAAHRRFPAGDTSPDYATSCKWLGYVRMELASSESARAEGRALLGHALKLLHVPAVRAEAWLDVLRLWDLVDKPDSVRTAALQAYPLCLTGYLHELGRAPGLTWGWDRGAHWRIDLGSGEHWERGSAALGVSKELHLLALARLAWPWPLNPVTAQALLWPDEAWAFHQLADRLKKLLGRLRTGLSMDIRVKQGWITLSAQSARAIVVSVSRDARPPSLLAGRTVIKPSEVDAYYGLSHSQRALALGRWIEQGWIAPDGRGRAARYSVLAGKEGIS